MCLILALRGQRLTSQALDTYFIYLYAKGNMKSSKMVPVKTVHKIFKLSLSWIKSLRNYFLNCKGAFFSPQKLMLWFACELCTSPKDLCVLRLSYQWDDAWDYLTFLETGGGEPFLERFTMDLEDSSYFQWVVHNIKEQCILPTLASWITTGSISLCVCSY